MPILGLIPEPPFEARSWSGSSAPFFRALALQGLLSDAVHVRLSSPQELIEKLRVLSWPLERWKERYHASVPRFRALTVAAANSIARCEDVDAALQVGAWFSSGSVATRPCFSYHDGNAALWYRHYGRGMLSAAREQAHLSWEREVYSRLTGIFVMSSWLASSFTSDFGVPSTKVHVVGAGVNMDSLPAIPSRDFSRVKFLFVGKDFERMGGRFLLEAFRKVKQVVAEAELVIVGPSLKIQEPGVTCAGFLSKSVPADLARLQEFFRTATAVVLPSVYEPFGISLTEGMAYGLPCIAVDRCAMPEIVRHGESGLIAAAEDSGSLARSMIELAQSPTEAENMGMNGRRRAESDFTWTSVAQKIARVLTDEYRIR